MCHAPRLEWPRFHVPATALPLRGGVRPGPLPRPRGPPRPTHCELHPAARRRGHPNTSRTSRSFVQTPHPAARLAAGLRPGAGSAPPAARVLAPTRSPSSARTHARHPSEARRPPAGAHPASVWPPGCGPPPVHRTHTKPGALTLPSEAPSAAALHLFPKRAASPCRPGPGAPAAGAGGPGSRGSRRGSRVRGAEPEPAAARRLRAQGAPWRALAFSSFSHKS